MFITFEGIDLTGKSTQCALLRASLERAGRRVIPVREPGGTALSEAVRHLLLDAPHEGMDPAAELLLFGAARAQLVAEVIAPALRAGADVIADRFHDSTTAYQGYGRNISLQAIEAVHGLALHGLQPDLTFFIDLEWDECLRRRTLRGGLSDRMERNDRAFFDRVRDGYRTIAARESDRIVTVDGRASIDEIAALVARTVDAHRRT